MSDNIFTNLCCHRFHLFTARFIIRTYCNSYCRPRLTWTRVVESDLRPIIPGLYTRYSAWYRAQYKLALTGVLLWRQQRSIVGAYATDDDDDDDGDDNDLCF